MAAAEESSSEEENLEKLSEIVESAELGKKCVVFWLILTLTSF